MCGCGWWKIGGEWYLAVLPRLAIPIPLLVYNISNHFGFERLKLQRQNRQVAVLGADWPNENPHQQKWWGRLAVSGPLADGRTGIAIQDVTPALVMVCTGPR